MILANMIRQLFTRQRASSVPELLAATELALAANDFAAAENAATALLARHPEHTGALHYYGLAQYRRSHFAEALAAWRRMEALGGSTDECYYLMAQCHYALGDMSSAQGCCENALRLNNDHTGAHEVMAAIALPGPYYTEVLSAIHHSLKPATYLEVGVFQGRSIALANPQTLAIGIDPAPNILVPLGKNVRIYTMTSDVFFRQHDLVSELGGRRLDLAFIDGMHHFDFALRDFAHIEPYCTKDSTVLVHDCYPLDRTTAARDRSTTFWSGDVWRMIVALKKYRPDLAIHTIGARPTGLALIRNLDPASRVLSQGLDNIIEEFSATDYSVLDRDKRGMLNWFPNDFTKIESLWHPLPNRL